MLGFIVGLSAAAVAQGRIQRAEAMSLLLTPAGDYEQKLLQFEGKSSVIVCYSSMHKVQ